MPALTIAQVFGANAAVSGGVLSIDLSDFTTVGLNGATPTASEIFTAILLQVISQQTPTSQEDIEIGVFIGEPFMSIVRDNSQIDRQFPVSVFTPFSASTLDPDDVIG